jgi:hypothetical protein
VSARFVRLTPVNAEDKAVWVNPAGIVCIGVAGDETAVTFVNSEAAQCVRETPEQILALLAEPAPSPSVEVTEAVWRAASAGYDEYCIAMQDTGNGPSEAEAWIAAIEAADRARGLRP